MNGAGMRAAVERARVAAQKRADVLRAGVRERIASALPGVTLVQDGDRIVVRGRDLVRRWIARDDLRNLREGER